MSRIVEAPEPRGAEEVRPRRGFKGARPCGRFCVIVEDPIGRHAQRLQMSASQQRIALAFDATRKVFEF